MPMKGWSFPIIETTVLVVAAVATLGYIFSRRKNSIKKTLVDPTAKYALPLIEKEELTHDTRRFRFKLPSENHVLGLPVGQHINLSAKIDDELVIRSYTPTSSNDDKGFMELIVKIYFKNTHPKFPAGGKMTQHLESLQIGETIDVRGPSGKLQYLGCGQFSIKNLRNEPPTILTASKVNLIAGGSGITPMLQLIRYSCKSPGDKTKFSLLFANQTEADILVRKELEQAQADHPEKVRIWYTVDTANEGWSYSTGFVNAEMIKNNLFPPTNDTITLMCGPPPMIKFACTPSLDSLGYDPKLRFVY